MEQSAIEQEIKEKAKEWADEYGADFLVELIDVYLEDTPGRLAQLRDALSGGDIETLTREAHTLKSSSANVGAMAVSAIAKEIETLGHAGKVDRVSAKAQQMELAFEFVKSTLEVIRKDAAASLAEL